MWSFLTGYSRVMSEEAPTIGLAEIRDRTNSLQSARTERTRERIRVAARALTAAGSVVNVKTIAEAADISRGTFYSHYAQLDELAADILAQDLQAQPFSVGNLVGLYVQHRDFYRRALLETTSRAVLESAVEITVKALVAQADAATVGDIPLEMLARFTAWGYIGILDWWLREDEPLSSVALAEFLRDRTPTVFRDQLR